MLYIVSYEFAFEHVLERESVEENEEEDDRLGKSYEVSLLISGIFIPFLLVIVGIITLYQFGHSPVGLAAGVLMVIIGVCMVIGVVKFTRASHED